MSLLAVILIVVILGLLAAFAPMDANFKRLLWFIAAGVVVLYLILLLVGAVDFGFPHRGAVIVH